jgi:hypothetical protein
VVALTAFDLGGGRTLDSLQRVDLFDGSWELGVPRLIGAVLGIVQAHRASPRPAPAVARPAGQRRDPAPAHVLEDSRGQVRQPTFGTDNASAQVPHMPRPTHAAGPEVRQMATYWVHNGKLWFSGDKFVRLREIHDVSAVKMPLNRRASRGWGVISLLSFAAALVALGIISVKDSSHEPFNTSTRGLELWAVAAAALLFTLVSIMVCLH